MNPDEPDYQSSQSSSLWTWLVIAAAALAVQVYFLLRAPDPLRQPDGHPAVGSRLPMVDLQPLAVEGELVSLATMEGQVALINLWATWCGPCVRELPHLADLEKSFADQPNFRMLAVRLDDNGLGIDRLRENTVQFLEKSDATSLSVYLDPNGATKLAIDTVTGSQGIPTTVVLDGQGIIRGVWIGYAPGADQDMRRLIEKLLDPS